MIVPILVMANDGKPLIKIEERSSPASPLLHLEFLRLGVCLCQGDINGEIHQTAILVECGARFIVEGGMNRGEN